MSEAYYPKHTASTNPHRVVMALCTLFVLAVCVGLVGGWKAFFHLRDKREILARVEADASVLRSGGAVLPSNPSSSAYKALPSTPEAMVRNVEAISEKTNTVTDGPTPSLMREVVKEKPVGVSLGDIAKTETTGKPIVSMAPVVENVSPVQLEVAADVLQKFWHAHSVESKAAYVLDRDRVEPLMRVYYEEQKNEDPPSGSTISRGGFRINGRSVLLFSFSSSRPGDVIEIALLPTSGGSYAIDWESYVGYSEMAWPAFKKSLTSSPKLFRCFAGRSDYYNFEFSDQAKYISVNVMSPDGLYVVHGYAKKESSIGKALEELFTIGAQHKGLILRLAFPENAQSDQCVLILGVVSDRWMVLAD